MKRTEQNKVAMVIVAHPDDAEFGAAGTVATWVRDGWDVYYVICTDATGGGPDDATDVGPAAKRRISDTRKSEQRAAGEVLGLKDVFFLDYPDGQLYPSIELRRDLVRLLRNYRPSRVICQSPERTWTPTLMIRSVSFRSSCCWSGNFGGNLSYVTEPLGLSGTARGGPTSS